MTEILAAKRLILTEWEKKRDELDMLISALRRELGLSAEESGGAEINVALPISVSTSTSPIKVDELVTPGDFFGMTQVGAAREFLQRLNKRTATLNEIGAALYRGKAISNPLAENGLKNLSSLLSRSDEFTSVAKGRWGLSEWYPNRAKKARKVTADAVVQPKEEAEAAAK